MLRPWDFKIAIRRDSTTPVYLQIVHALIDEIRRGRLSSGTALPGTRELAAGLDVNRKTVVDAYRELEAQGWVQSESTRGTFRWRVARPDRCVVRTPPVRWFATAVMAMPSVPVPGAVPSARAFLAAADTLP